MNKFTINFISSTEPTFTLAGVWNSLTPLQKRVLGIALLALTALSISYCFLSCFWNKNIAQVNEKQDEDCDQKVPEHRMRADKAQQIAIDMLYPEQEFVVNAMEAITPDPEGDHAVDREEASFTSEQADILFDASEAMALEAELAHAVHREEASLTSEQTDIVVDAKEAMTPETEKTHVELKEDALTDNPADASDPRAEMTSKPEVTQILARYRKVKDQKIECESYFNKLCLSSPTEFIAAYQLVKKDASIVAMIVDGAIENCDTYYYRNHTSEGEKTQIVENFTLLLDTLAQDQDDLFALIEILLDRMKMNKWSASNKLNGIFQHLSADQYGNFTKVMLNLGFRWEKLMLLIDILEFDQGKIDNSARIHKIADVMLPSFWNDSLMQRLWNSPIVFSAVCSRLPLKHYELLIKSWQGSGSNKHVYVNLVKLFNMTKPTLELVEICIKLGIDIDKLLTLLQDRNVIARLSGLYAVHVLKNKSQPIAATRITPLISLLDPLDTVVNEFLIFTKLLAKHSSIWDCAFLIPLFSTAENRQRLGIGFLSTLLNHPNPDHEKIKEAFRVYWGNWKQFDNDDDEYSPFGCAFCSYAILPAIKSEEILKLVYEAAPAAMRDEIKDHLGQTHHYNDGWGNETEYKVSLPQDVLDRVLK